MLWELKLSRNLKKPNCEWNICLLPLLTVPTSIQNPIVQVSTSIHQSKLSLYDVKWHSVFHTCQRACFKLSNNKSSATSTSFYFICQNQRLQLQKITTTKMIFLQFQESSRNSKSTFESLKEIQRTTKDSLDSYTKAGANTN